MGMTEDNNRNNQISEFGVDEESIEANVNGHQPLPKSVETADRLSVEEQKRLAKLNQTASSNPIPSEYHLDPDRPASVERSVSDNPALKTGFVLTAVGGGMGLLALIWFGFVVAKPSTRQTAEQPEEQASPKIVPNESAELRGRLAFQDQQQAIRQNPPPTRTRSTHTPTRMPPRTVSSPSPPGTIAAPARLTAAPPVIYQPAPISRPSQPIDPFERWSQLANVGQQRADMAIVAEAANQPTLIDPSPQPIAEQPTLTNSQFSSPQPTLTAQIDRAHAAGFPAQPKLEDSRILPTAATVPSSPAILPRPSAPGYVASTRLEEVAIGSPDALDETGLSPGAKGILSRTAVTPFAATAPDSKAVALGTATAAQVMMPMVWDTDGANDPPMQRFAVELTEDMKAMDNSVALPVGTIFVTETNQVSKSTKLVNASAIAVIYPDQDGNIHQETLPAGAVLLRGKAGEALVAKALNDPGDAISGQDLLIGVLSSLGTIGERFNQPNIEARTATSNDRFAQTIVTRSRKPELWAAALEGFFAPLADRLAKRSDRAVEEMLNRPTVAVLPEGTETSIVINSTFRVTR